VIEIVARIDAVQGHHAPHRGAVVAPVGLLHPPCFLGVDLQPVGDVAADAHVDLGEEIAARRIERVVEVEQPDVWIVERRHGPELTAHRALVETAAYKGGNGYPDDRAFAGRRAARPGAGSGADPPWWRRGRDHAPAARLGAQ